MALALCSLFSSTVLPRGPHPLHVNNQATNIVWHSTCPCSCLPSQMVCLTELVRCTSRPYNFSAQHTTYQQYLAKPFAMIIGLQLHKISITRHIFFPHQKKSGCPQCAMEAAPQDCPGGFSKRTWDDLGGWNRLKVSCSLKFRCEGRSQACIHACRTNLPRS